jgi:hypothetical protein
VHESAATPAVFAAARNRDHTGRLTRRLGFLHIPQSFGHAAALPMLVHVAPNFVLD